MRNAPGEPLVVEAVETMQALSHDFIKFQEVYLRYDLRNNSNLRRETDEFITRDLDLTCFSPTKITFEPTMQE